MDSALYRHGLPVTPGSIPSRPTNNFYTFDDVDDRHLYASPYSSSGNQNHRDVNLSAGSTPRRDSYQGAVADINKKVDQMMTMLSSTQYLLVAQQATTTHLEESVAKLSQDVVALQQSDVSDSKQSKPSKKIPKELSNAVKKIHSSVEDEYHFVGSELFVSDTNQKAADYITEAEFGTKYDLHVIKCAVYRYFESRRRIHNDSLPHRKDAVVINKRKAQRKACQARLYERRNKVLMTKKEKDKFEQIDMMYMTEESMDEDDDEVRQHKHPWRSEKLDTFIAKLDCRRADEKSGITGFSLKSRVNSTPSTSSPPAGAPTWAIRCSINQPPPQTVEPNTSSGETPLRTQQTVANSGRKKLTVEDVLDGANESSGSEFSLTDSDA